MAEDKNKKPAGKPKKIVPEEKNEKGMKVQDVPEVKAMTPEQILKTIEKSRSIYKDIPQFIYGDSVDVVSGFYKGQKGMIFSRTNVIAEEEYAGKHFPEVITGYKIIFSSPIGIETREVEARDMKKAKDPVKLD